MLGTIPAAAPADLRHGRDVQSGHPARRLRLQPSERRPSATSGSSIYDALADSVAKPTIAPPDNPRVRPMIFYGYDPALRDRSGLGAAQAVRHPSSSATTGGGGGRSRPSCCRRSSRFAISWARSGSSACGGTSLRPRVRTPGPRRRSSRIPRGSGGCASAPEPSVMYTDVIRTMSSARINIFTQRPVLHHLKHLTLKYFEIFYADTIPLLMLDEDVAARGLRARTPGSLLLRGRVAEKLLDALRRPDHYRDVVQERPPPPGRALLLRPAGRGAGRGDAGLTSKARDEAGVRLLGL